MKTYREEVRGRLGQKVRWRARNECRAVAPGRHYSERLVGPMWREGRLWITVGPEDAAKWPPQRVTLTWQVPSHHVGVSLTVEPEDAEEDCTLMIGAGAVLFVSVEGLIPRRWRRFHDHAGDAEDREIGLTIHDGTLWWRVWSPSESWSSRTPKWRDGNWTPLDTLLGRPVYAEQELVAERVLIPLPEKSYPARVRFFESTWTRPRWPFPRRMVRAEVTPDQPIPFPGKGENSWDMGEDAIREMTCPAETPEAAIASMVESVLRDRRRHGGSVTWRPAGATPAGGEEEEFDDDTDGDDDDG